MPRNLKPFIEMIGHASLRVQYNGKILLTDPWYVDPINCNSLFHWPALVHDVKKLAEETDIIYISHVHPDHFDPRTLEFFSKDIPVYIGKYKLKAFYNELKSIGFKNVFEVPFQTPTEVVGTDFQISILESDYAESAAYDSSIVIKTPEFTVFNNNDCLLHKNKYEWVKANYTIDYGFLGYSPASFYPICFEFEASEKQRILKQDYEKHYNQFLQAAEILKPKLSLPFAMGIRFLHPSMTWQNISFNRPEEAVRRLASLDLRGDILNPGDKITQTKIERRAPLLLGKESDDALVAYAKTMATYCEGLWASEPPARSDIVDQFKKYITDLWQNSQNSFPEVKENVIAFEVEGPSGGNFYFDFSRAKNDIFVSGAPKQFDMRYRYEDKMLQLCLDGKIDWDELHFSNRLQVIQNRYAASFYGMLRSQGDLLSRNNL